MFAALRRWIVVAAVLAGLGLAASAEAGSSRGLTVPVKASIAAGAPVAEEVELYSKSYALVIGVDGYSEGWPRLGQAVKDARSIAQALESQGFEVTLKTNLNARELRRTFEDFFIEKGGDPDARLFVWYAGHGHTDARGEGYLIPADGALERDRRRFLRTALSLRRFGEFVRLAASKHVFTIFDSCFAGTIFNVARAAPPPQITRVTTQPVRQFLTSGDAGQQVSDDGTFARLFIEALLGERPADGNGDGYLTASELGAFLDGKMSNYTQNRQTPRFGKLRSPEFDKGDFVFALPGNDGPSAARKSITQSSGVTPDERVWRVVQNSTDPTDFMTFIRNFPDSPFIAFAKAKLKKLTSGRKVAKLTPPAKKPASGAASAGGDRENTLYMDLEYGRVVIELKPDLAPRHVARIKELTRQGFYDGIVFHRVIDKFMAQTGDPTGTGQGGSGQKLKAEFNNAKHVRGAVSMARARDLNSADSQFFIVYKDASFLDGQYTIWGQVTDGMEFVDRIKKGAGQGGAVKNPDKIVRMRVAADVKG